MKKLIYIFLFFTVSLSAQTPWAADSFDIIFEQDFNDDTEGPYLDADYNGDWWEETSPSLDLDWTSIYNYNGNKAMRWDYANWSSHLWSSFDPAYGDYPLPTNWPFLAVNGIGGVDEDNIQWGGRKGTQGDKFYSYFNAAHEEFDEIYMSYDVMFKPDFWFAASGKIPGLMNSPYYLGVDPTQGSRGGLSWKGPYNDNSRPDYTDGRFSMYIYDHNRVCGPGEVPWVDDCAPAIPYTITVHDPYSSDQYFRINPSTEKWIHVTLRQVLNSPLTENNGRYEVFINGRLMESFGQAHWREVAGARFNIARMYTQFGGEGVQFHTLREEWIMIDNVKIWRYADNVVGVRRGTGSSGTNAELHLPLSWSNTTATWDDESPVIAPPIPDQSILSGETFDAIPLDNNVSDNQDADADLTWSYSGDDGLTVDITDRVATITYAEGWTGAEAITFEVEDTDTNTDNDVAVFRVRDVSVLPDYQAILINLFRYDDDQPSSTLNGEVWNHFNGETDNDVDQIHQLYNTEGTNYGFTLNVDSVSAGEVYSHSTGYYLGDVYNDSCEATHWRVDGAVGYLSIDGFTVDNEYSLKVYSSALWASGNTEVTFLDTAKTATTPDNVTLLEWRWTAENTSEVLSWEGLTYYGYINVIEINEWFEDTDIPDEDLTLTDTIQAEWACEFSENAVTDAGGEYIGQEVVISTPDTAWFEICNVDFGDGGWEQVGFNTSTYMSNTGMGLKIDSNTADSIAYVILENTDLYSNYVTNYTPLFEDITGVHDVFIQGYNNQSACDYIVFSQSTPPSGPTIRHRGRLCKYLGNLLKR